MALEDDIARIAAMRGRPVSEFTLRPPRSVSTAELDSLLRMGTAPGDDLAVLDALPAASRALIRDWEKPINTRAWANLLEQHMDEAFLIRTFKAWYLKTTGREGPSPVRKPRRRLS